jgi:hypothetical protein
MKSGLKLALLFLFFSACSYNPYIMQLKPQGIESKFYRGSEYVHLENNDVDIYVAFLRPTSQDFSFNFMITNKSEEQLFIDPATFYATIDSFKIDKFDEPTTKTIYARDPEKRIKRLQRDEINNAKKQTNETNLFLIFGLFHTLSAVHDLTSDQPDEIKKRNEKNRSEFLDNHIETIEQLEEQEQDIQSELENYSTHYLRKTHLNPKTSMQGILCYPKVKHGTKITIYFPINGETITLTYDLIKDYI